MTDTRPPPKKPARKPRLGEWVSFAESNPPKGYKFQSGKWVYTEVAGSQHWAARGFFAGESNVAKLAGYTHWLAIPTPPEQPKSHV